MLFNKLKIVNSCGFTRKGKKHLFVSVKVKKDAFVDVMCNLNNDGDIKKAYVMSHPNGGQVYYSEEAKKPNKMLSELRISEDKVIQFVLKEKGKK